MSVIAAALDRVLGRGRTGVTVPVMDGPFKPNRALDDAPVLARVAAIDNLASRGDVLLCTSGADLLHLRLDRDGAREIACERLAGEITSLAIGPDGTLAAGIAGLGVALRSPDGAWRAPTGFGQDLGCVTALLFLDAETLVVANGSAIHACADWKRDLMSQGRSGSVWRCGLAGASATRLAGDLGFPFGLERDAGGQVLVSESWRHRILALPARGGGRPAVVAADLPAYPARIAPRAGGGFLLAMFAPRNQLVEFILREDGYRRAMMAEVDPASWVAPMLGPQRTIDAPLQAGAVRQMGILKPWAPSLSCGLAVECDAGMRPRASWHSRTDGARHGVTSVCEHGGRTLVAARGAGALIALDAPSVSNLGAAA